MGKVLAGGFVGGMIVFLWGFVAHVVLPLGEAGLKTIPLATEDAVLASMRGAIQEPGTYFFPGMDMSHESTDAEREAWTKKAVAGPAGLLIYQVHGEDSMTRQLVTEAATNIASAMLAAIVLLHVAAGVGFGRRVLLTALLGLFATLVVNVPYWNWYHFDATFTLAALAENTIGWFLAGLWLARVCRQ